MKALVEFIGAGPGAEDLITVRGLRALEQADLVVYAGSLVNPGHLKACKPGCECLDSASMNLGEQVEAMSSAALAGKRVVRLHTGDPAMYGAINEQIRALAEKGVASSITPGVSSVFAGAAALGCELTMPDGSQSVVLTRTPGRTPMPESEDAASFARTGATLVFFLSTGNIEALMRRLMQEGGLGADTPAAVVYRASWPDERILRGTVNDIALKVEEAGFGRQALIFVGRALEASNGESRLYGANFSHGYRNTLAGEAFDGRCALYAFTDKGLTRAREIAAGLGLPTVIYCTRPTTEEGVVHTPGERFNARLAAGWNKFAAHIFVGATGIAVRKIAPLLNDKSSDPAVLACAESGSHVVSLASGHLGGANRLARRVARITGGQAVISTATDVNGLTAFDEAAALEHARILNTRAIRRLNAALLAGETIAFCGPRPVFERYFAMSGQVLFAEVPEEITARYAVLWDAAGDLPEGVEHLAITSRAFVLGIGCRRGVEPEDLQRVARAHLAALGLHKRNIAALASCDIKADEPAILDLGDRWGVAVESHPAEKLDAVPVPTPSETVRAKVGSGSVSEAACLLSAGYGSAAAPRLYAPKKIFETCRGQVTLALARLPHLEGAGSWREACPDTGPGACPETGICPDTGPGSESGLVAGCIAGSGYGFAAASGCGSDACPESDPGSEPGSVCGRVLVVGLGSGAPGQITPEVDAAIRQCDTIAGYTRYVDFIRDRIAGKRLIQSGMMGEVERCRATLEAAAAGSDVCMVCSGDPGILAMAGLLYELRTREGRFSGVPVRVLPGITAANIAAASLGAPLQNGFSLISLSDLLVPADEVRQNLLAVAGSALPVALYNPAGRKRRHLLEEALTIFRDRRGEEVLCAFVKNAGRPRESKWVGRLCEFPSDEVDMSTLVFIGGERTRFESGVLYEARGYIEKYME